MMALQVEEDEAQGTSNVPKARAEVLNNKLQWIVRYKARQSIRKISTELGVNRKTVTLAIKNADFLKEEALKPLGKQRLTKRPVKSPEVD